MRQNRLDPIVSVLHRGLTVSLFKYQEQMSPSKLVNFSLRKNFQVVETMFLTHLNLIVVQESHFSNKPSHVAARRPIFRKFSTKFFCQIFQKVHRRPLKTQRLARLWLGPEPGENRPDFYFIFEFSIPQAFQKKSIFTIFPRFGPYS